MINNEKMIFLNTSTIIVPVGSSCSVASYLRLIGFRKEAFPFDWNVTPIDDAIKLINTKFEGFLDDKYLVYLEPTKRLLFHEDGINMKSTDDMITPVYCVQTNMLFVHDFSINGKKDFKKVKEKYNRRIKRLNEITDNQNLKIIFVYDDALPNKWQDEQYKKVNYNFRTLKNNDLKQKIKRNNVDVMSLKTFKQKTILLSLIISFKRYYTKYLLKENSVK